jgi:hypothetical protein
MKRFRETRKRGREIIPANVVERVRPADSLGIAVISILDVAVPKRMMEAAHARFERTVERRNASPQILRLAPLRDVDGIQLGER